MKRPTYSLNRYDVKLKDGLSYTYELSNGDAETPEDREIFLGEIKIKIKERIVNSDCLFICVSSGGSKIIKPYSFDSDTLEFLDKEISIAKSSKEALENDNENNSFNLNIIPATNSGSGG